MGVDDLALNALVGDELRLTDGSSRYVAAPQHVAFLPLVSGHQRGAAPPCGAVPRSGGHQGSGGKGPEDPEAESMVVGGVYLPYAPGSPRWQAS